MALLRLERESAFAPIRLNVGGDAASPATALDGAQVTSTVIGWGATRQDGPAAGKLLGVNVPTVSTAARRSF